MPAMMARTPTTVRMITSGPRPDDDDDDAPGDAPDDAPDVLAELTCSS